MKNYKVEYLSIINTKGSFCNSVNSFNNLLQSYGDLKITDSHIEFENLIFDYEVLHGEINADDQKFFHIKITCNSENNLHSFRKLLKSIRIILTKTGEKLPETLWDDVSSELANKAYPIVHDVENLMRKLITKFMLITIGLGWTKDAVPKEVSESLKTKKDVSNLNYLYEVDFIQLSNFLFKKYSTENAKDLIERLDVAKSTAELDLGKLKQLVPKSNWERYFSPIVDCKSEYLEARWGKLYELRCMIAHNKFITNEDYDEIIRNSKEIKLKLIKAIEGLEKINVPEEQKEEVAENIASNLNHLFGEFIVGWKAIQDLLIRLYNAYFPNDYISAADKVIISKAIVRPLVDKEVLTKDLYDFYKAFNSIRNAIVHNSNIVIEDATLKYYLFDLDVFKSDLIKILELKKNEKIDAL